MGNNNFASPDLWNKYRHKFDGLDGAEKIDLPSWDPTQGNERTGPSGDDRQQENRNVDGSSNKKRSKLASNFFIEFLESLSLQNDLQTVRQNFQNL